LRLECGWGHHKLVPKIGTLRTGHLLHCNEQLKRVKGIEPSFLSLPRYKCLFTRGKYNI
jgi:hypothetical protein